MWLRRSPRSRNHGFTLVELLVVIGIIALLISILLPALSAARRQAAAVKCAAHLREIGNAFAMYAGDNKGYFPPAQLQSVAPNIYNIDGTDFPQQGVGAYWFHFLQKYVTKSKLGFASSTIATRADARNNVLWGCTAWTGYQSAGYTGGINVNQPGYGMNVWPTFQAGYTPKQTTGADPKLKERVFIQNWNQSTQLGTFIKQTTWGRQGAQRCLVADSIFWETEAQRVPATGMLGQALANNTVAAGNHAFSLGNTLTDAYRHGKYPKQFDGASHEKIGGKVAFNILYCDGHVVTSVDRTEAFRSLRMRYPN